MTRIFILSIFLGCVFAASSQGSWDIGYIEIDSITTKDITRLVKIDFRHNHTGEMHGKNRSVRHFVDTRDTGQVVIEKDTVDLIERRKIYTDHGSYGDQYLECPDYASNQLLRAYETEIMDVKEDAILFRLYFEIYHKRKGKINSEPYRDAALYWIKKDKLDGVLIKK